MSCCDIFKSMICIGSTAPVLFGRMVLGVGVDEGVFVACGVGVDMGLPLGCGVGVDPGLPELEGVGVGPPPPPGPGGVVPPPPPPQALRRQARAATPIVMRTNTARS